MHKIVYIDQNYVSNMAKAQCGHTEKKEGVKFWQSVFETLKAAVLSDEIACPKLEFHDTESMYDKRFEEPILRVIDELSVGLEFNSFRHILQTQIEDAAREFLGLGTEQREPWVIAFQSDPHAPVDSRLYEVLGQKGRISVHFSLSGDLVEYHREGKLQFQERARILLADDKWKKLKLLDLLSESKKGVIRGFMGDVAEQEIRRLQQQNTKYSLRTALSKLNTLENIWNGLRSTGIDTQDTGLVQQFIYSEQLLGIPFVEINGSIWVIVARNYLDGRDIGQGDIYDVPILSTVLPYCDIVTTDSYMKEIITHRIDSNSKYGVEVFSGKQSDVVSFQTRIHSLMKT